MKEVHQIKRKLRKVMEIMVNRKTMILVMERKIIPIAPMIISMIRNKLHMAMIRDKVHLGIRNKLHMAMIRDKVHLGIRNKLHMAMIKSKVQMIDTIKDKAIIMINMKKEITHTTLMTETIKNQASLIDMNRNQAFSIDMIKIKIRRNTADMINLTIKIALKMIKWIDTQEHFIHDLKEKYKPQFKIFRKIIFNIFSKGTLLIILLLINLDLFKRKHFKLI
jgi:hypothetical protein